MLLGDGARAPCDPPIKIVLARRQQPGVKLRDRIDARDRNEMVASQPPDLTLNAALLMRARDPGRREQRLKQVVRAQRDEAIGLHPPATLQHLLDRRGQVVVADLREHPVKPLERVRVTLETPAASRPVMPSRTPPRRSRSA